MFNYKPAKPPVIPITDPLHSLPRVPIAVDAWFPTGKKTKPKILQFKIKDNEDNIITVSNIVTHVCEQSYYYGSAVLEFRCEIAYLYQKKNVIIYFFPRDLKWELSFIP